MGTQPLWIVSLFFCSEEAEEGAAEGFKQAVEAPGQEQAGPGVDKPSTVVGTPGVKWRRSRRQWTIGY